MQLDDLAAVIAEAITVAQAPLLARLAVLESRAVTKTFGEKGEKGDPGERGEMGPVGPAGADAVVDLEAVARAAAALIPVPRDGLDGKDGRDGVDGKDGAPGRDGQDGVAGPAGLDGTDGAPGVNGKDGVGVRDATLDAGGTLLLHFTDGFTKSVGVIVGRDGAPGVAGARGAQGDPGRDGIGVAGALLDKDGGLVLTLSDGTVKALGRVVGHDGVDGQPGARGEQGSPGLNGRDGTLEHLKAVYDGERTITLCFKDGTPIEGGAIKLTGLSRYQGIWSRERAYEAGDQTTYGGSQWTAIADAPAGLQPGTNEGAAAWKLSVKKGNDGKDGKHGKDGINGRDGKDGADRWRS
jgi:hypothetical protein